MSSPVPASTTQLKVCEVVGYPPTKPWVLPYTCSPWWVLTDAPSELLIRASNLSAAASHDLAISMARSAVTFQGCERSRFEGERAMSAASASPEAASSAVNRAILQAFATVARTASREKSAVLAEPLRCPK